MSSDRDDRFSTPAGRSVALFIDWDNFAIGLRQEMPERPADVGPILRWARRFGVLTICRAYGEWRDAAERLALYNAGVEVVYAPVLPLGGSVMARNGGGAKSLADTAMAVDVTELLALMPTVSTVVLATSDKDLIPVLRFAQRRGLFAAVVGSDRTAGALRDLADEYVSYRQLLDAEGAPSAQTRPVAVPPMRYPRGVRPALPTPPVEAYTRRQGRGITLPATSVGLAGASPGFVTPPGPGVRVRPAATPETEEAAEHTLTPASALRRRRRGGRRRRGQEVGGIGDADLTLDAGLDLSDESEPDVTEAPEAEFEDVEEIVAASTEEATTSDERPEPEEDVEAERAFEPVVPVAPDGEDAIAEQPASAPVEDVPAASPERIETPRMEAPTEGGPSAAGRGTARPEAPARRAPVVLPGERIKRLAPSTPDATSGDAQTTTGQASAEASSPAREESPPASEEQSESQASAATPTTVDTDADVAPVAEANAQQEVESPAEAEPESPAGGKARGRSRRRGGNSRASRPDAGEAAESPGEPARASATPEGSASSEADAMGGADEGNAEAAEATENGEQDAEGKPARSGSRGRSRRRGSRSH